MSAMEQFGARMLLGRCRAPTDAKLKLSLPPPLPQKLSEKEPELRRDAEEETQDSDFLQRPRRTKARCNLSQVVVADDLGETTNEEAPVTPEMQNVIDPNTFSVKSELGKGAFGSVFLVQHLETRKRYAMKVLDKAKYSKEAIMPYALREKNMHMNLRHPCIVGLHHAFQTKTRLVMLLQYCPGGCLAALLARHGALPEGLTRFYVAEVLLALGHLHEHRVVHRDVKPANVLLDAQRHALLTDFGLCKEELVGNPNGLRSFAGSLFYLAPEILRRTGHGRMVDVYNLGTMAFELMSKHIPFFHPDRKEFRTNVKTATLRCPSHFSALAEDFVLATMAKEPEKRLGAATTADVQAHAWFKPLEFDDILERKVDPPRLQQGRSTSQARGRTGASPFAVDQQPELPEHRVEDWDFTGASFQAALPQGSPARRSSSLRLSCLLTPLQCLRSERAR